MDLFQELYPSCFKNASLLKIPRQTVPQPVAGTTNGHHQNHDNESGCVTLDSVFEQSEHVGFYFTSVYSTFCSNFASQLAHFCQRQGVIPPAGDGDSTSNGSSNCQSSPAKRRFFGVVGPKRSKSGKKSSKNGGKPSTSSGSNATTTTGRTKLSVVVVCLDPISIVEKIPVGALGAAGWYALAPDAARTKSRLLRALRFQQAPGLTVVDCRTKQVITADGRRDLIDDLEGINFPWRTPSMSTLLEGSYLRASGDGSKLEQIGYSDIKPGVKALFFGANWCPPCRAFTKQLLQVYDNVKNRHGDTSFEVVYCSSDRSKDSFEHHFATMPWLSFPYADDRSRKITRKFNVHGIPALLILDERGELITRHGRNAVLSDLEGVDFPWKSKALYELTEFTLNRLKDEPSLILFTEGSPDDVTYSIELLKPFAEVLYSEKENALTKDDIDHPCPSNGTAASPACDSVSASSTATTSSDSDAPVPRWADPLQVFYTGTDPICDQMLDGLGLGEAELPLLAILDVKAGLMAVCEQPDVSAEIVQQFVDQYKADRLKTVEIPTATVPSMPSQVGGIPVNAISQALWGVPMSPSQNSFAISPKAANGNE